ncbi:MAG: hypothetical protein ACR2GD_10565 [Pyrinomonadaceae bacterium]
MNIIGFAICLENSGCDDLELNKIYPVAAAEANDPKSYLRIIDESEEDYIYPREMFEIVNLPAQVQSRVLENIAA